MLDASLLLPEHPRPLRRAEYDRLVALGAFEDERVELLHGVLVDMSPNYPEHASPIDRLNAILTPALVGKARVRIQLPLVAHDESEPEPDVAVVPQGDYRSQHPAEALLVIEVALSSLNKDRNVKAPLYAASGFREYWIVDVAEKAIEVHCQPADGRYTLVTRHAAGESLRPEAFPGVAVSVDDVLGCGSAAAHLPRELAYAHMATGGWRCPDTRRSPFVLWALPITRMRRPPTGGRRFLQRVTASCSS